jgi:SulP family sulfate permease
MDNGSLRCSLKTRLGRKQPHRVFLDNWQSGLTVAMVSVPLSISLGIASVAGDDPAAPVMGVDTAFWGGLCASLFGSSDLNIVGPAGALSGMLNTYTIQFNGAQALPYISLLSSVFVFLIWALNLQRYLLLMPKAVFEGFSFAVAIIIGLNQLNMAFDLHPPGPKHEHFYENVLESLKVLDEAQACPTVFFLVNTVVLLGLMKYAKEIKGKQVPWTVIIPLLTLIPGYLADTDRFGGLNLPTLKTKFGLLEPRFFSPPSKPLSYYADGNMGGILVASVGVAFVAVLETAISAKIAEQKLDWPFDNSQETFGLGISHLVCGAVGCMPPTGVFVRTSLNVQLGATHRASQLINALIVLLISVLAMPVFSYLPQASVAALLVMASVRMAPINYIKELWRNDKGSFNLLIFTTLVCVFLDPVYGLVVGMVVALLRDAAETAVADSRLTTAAGAQTSGTEAKLTGDDKVAIDIGLDCDEHPGSKMVRQTGAGEETKVLKSDEDESGCSGARTTVHRSEEFDASMKLANNASPVMSFINMLRSKRQSMTQAKSKSSVGVSDICGAALLYEPIGPIVYLAADRHQARLQALIKQKPEAVLVSLENVTRVDVDGSMALGKAIGQLQKAGITVQVVQPESLQSDVLSKATWLEKLRGEDHVFANQADALRRRSSAKGQAKAEEDEVVEM